MGDRRNIIVKSNDTTALAMYTHWGGSEVPETLAAGLKRATDAGRADDPPYLSRILFDTLTGCDGAETGYGLESFDLATGDNNYSESDAPGGYDPLVDPAAQTVTLNGETLSFAEFIARHL